MNCGDRKTAAEALNNILMFRDAFINWDLWPAYSAAMNILGFSGFHAPDWAEEVSDEVKEEIRSMMHKIGEV